MAPPSSLTETAAEDLSKTLRGYWLDGLKMQTSTNFQITTIPTGKAIVYRDKTTGEYHTCTHLPNFVTFYAAFHRIEQDSVTGELGVKVTACQKYAAMKRGIARAALPST